ncbi:MAG: hypothetical protein M1343_14900 [Chloroflexi bacterium]|nr:hypothetical protein [Chloroflexota bacterium]MDA8188310.1 hypothetical protein [Dehalococcoidales bacterium]
MAEAEKQVHQCTRCGITSKDRVLLSAEFNGEERWVCVACLPYLIHGAE